MRFVSPNKPKDPLLETTPKATKNPSDSFSKFEFSFKKKEKEDLGALASRLTLQVAETLQEDPEPLNRSDLLTVLRIRSRDWTPGLGEPSYRLAQSAFIVCQLLRGNFSKTTTLRGSFEKLWPQGVSKKEYFRVIETVDHALLLNSRDDGCEGSFASTQLRDFYSMKLKFTKVGVSRKQVLKKGEHLLETTQRPFPPTALVLYFPRSGRVVQEAGLGSLLRFLPTRVSVFRCGFVRVAHLPVHLFFREVREHPHSQGIRRVGLPLPTGQTKFPSQGQSDQNLPAELLESRVSGGRSPGHHLGQNLR